MPLCPHGAFHDVPGREKKNDPNCADGLHPEMRDSALATCDNYKDRETGPQRGSPGKRLGKKEEEKVWA